MDTVHHKEPHRHAMAFVSPRVAELVAVELVKLGLPFACGPRTNNEISLSVDDSRRDLLGLLIERMTKRASK